MFCHSARLCAATPIVSNGHLIEEYARYQVLTVVRYKCDVGHQVSSGDEELMCSMNAEWLGMVPVCSGQYHTLDFLTKVALIIVI